MWTGLSFSVTALLEHRMKETQARAALFYFDPAWLDAWAGGRLILAEAARHTATCGREL